MNSKTSFVDKVIKSAATPIHFITCKDINQRDCFYVIMCSKAKLKTIMETETDISDLGQEGHILACGFGHEIPPAVKAMLKDKYNFDADSLK